ncbi:MAG: ribosome small subunit-dependent GTPase A [Elusimicrobia bacterium]|nr:ribosome small subunit-dependent GTPase A [Elusimicrobiota bacterium]
MAEKFNFEPGDFFSKEINSQIKEGEIAARIFAQHCDLYEASDIEGNNILLSFSGKLKKEITNPALKPIVGDWVIAYADGNINRIKKVLPRISVVKRIWKEKREQILAVNCSLILIANSADKTFSISRLKKYAALAENSGLPYEIILTKKDLSLNSDDIVKNTEFEFKKTPFLINCLDESDAKKLFSALKPKETSLLLGPSGCGKSTLINTLCSDYIMKTSAVREKDFKGRHTTTVRRIVPIPNGHFITDIPGIKLIEESVPDSIGIFSLIEEIALKCRFSDCRHDSEPGCAVKEAVEKGEISAQIYDSWIKHLKKGG